MSSAVFSRLWPVVATSYGVQLSLASVFVPLHEDRFYDFSGSVGFLSSTAVSLLYPYLRRRFWIGDKAAEFPGLAAHAPRQILATAALSFWTIRLGTFLFSRAIAHGGDSRFDEIKKQPGRFMVFWVAQATWVTLVGLPVYIVNALPARAHPRLGIIDYAGLALFASSLLFETIADRQKSAWRQEQKQKKHEEKFISRGPWGISRHPNYVGEIGTHAGIALMALTAFKSPLLPTWAAVSVAISPLMTYYILAKATGVPPLERAGDAKFGSEPAYQQYKKNTPILFPWGPKGDFSSQ